MIYVEFLHSQGKLGIAEGLTASRFENIAKGARTALYSLVRYGLFAKAIFVAATLVDDFDL